MKTATFPSLRVTPELRLAAESVLQEGESLSSFVAQSIRTCVERRRLQQEFIARGLASREEAKRSGEYFSVDDIRDDMDRLLRAAEANAATAE